MLAGLFRLRLLRFDRLAVNRLRQLDPKALRDYLKDGNWGGVYQRSDEEMMKIWQVAVQETLELLNEGWAK